jgi:hypothetical protein
MTGTSVTTGTLAGSPWLRRAYYEVCRHRHLIIHGMVDDLVKWEFEYMDFTVALERFLRHVGFEVVASYDPVDGLAFSDQAERDAFFEHVPAAEPRSGTPAREPVTAMGGRGPVPEPTPAPEPASAPGAADGDGRTDRQRRLEASRSGVFDAMRRGRRAELRTPADALAGIRAVLATTPRACAVLLDFADLLLGSEGSLDESYRSHLIQIGKIMRSAATVTTSSGSLRNTLVLVARRLSAIPNWLVAENPAVAAVMAEKPGAVERADFVLERRAQFHEGASLPPEAAQNAARVLANLAEGMTIRELIALSATSRTAGIPLTASKRLILHHRFGLRQDPWEQLDAAKVARAKEELSGRVMGQPIAVQTVAEMLVNANIGLDFVRDEDSSSTRPKGVFFFVGPTGVGKTELAKSIAELVFGDEAALRRFDMSEFGEPHSAERLTGAPPGYIGHDAGGVLTNWVLEHPFSVLLFDEIEKADPKVFDKFLHIIDDGRLTDGQGRTAFFSHTVVVFTSNEGSSELYRQLGEEGRRLPQYEQVRRLYQQAVDDYFSRKLGRPELLGRLGQGIVVFDLLREDVLKQIAAKFLDQLRASARAKGYLLVFDEQPIVDLAVREATSTGIRLGARQIRDPILERLVRTPLNRWILQHRPARGARIIVHLAADGERVQIMELPPAAA